jgi:hypothetical protein
LSLLAIPAFTEIKLSFDEAIWALHLNSIALCLSVTTINGDLTTLGRVTAIAGISVLFLVTPVLSHAAHSEVFLRIKFF